MKERITQSTNCWFYLFLVLIMFQVQILGHTVYFTLPSIQGLHVKTWDCYNGHLMIGDREVFWPQDRDNNHSLIEKHTWHDDFRKTKFSCNSCLFCYKEWMLLPYLWLKKTIIMMETKTEENNNNKPGRPEYTPPHTTPLLIHSTPLVTQRSCCYWLLKLQRSC